MRVHAKDIKLPNYGHVRGSINYCNAREYTTIRDIYLACEHENNE